MEIQVEGTEAIANLIWSEQWKISIEIEGRLRGLSGLIVRERTHGKLG